MNGELAELNLRVAELQSELADCKRKGEALQRNEKTLQNAVVTATDEEKVRIARDLHDGLGQVLTGIGILSQGLTEVLQSKGLPDIEYATRISSAVNDAMNRTRSIVRGIMPFGMGPGGLAQGLGELADSVEQLYGIKCQVRGTGELLIEKSNTAMQVYRVTQELITNAIRHGEAKHITIIASQREGQGTVTIEDDGCHLSDDDDLEGGLGLRIMRERVRSIGGRLRFVQGANGGSRGICEFPAS